MKLIKAVNYIHNLQDGLLLLQEECCMALIIPPGLSASRLSFMDGSQADIAKIDMLLLKVLTVEMRNTGCIQVNLLYYLHPHSALCILQKRDIFLENVSAYFYWLCQKLAKRISIPPQQFSHSGQLPKLHISKSAQTNLPHPEKFQ